MSRLRNFQLSFPNQPIKTIDEMCSGLSLLHRLMTLSFDLENSNVDDVSVLD